MCPLRQARQGARIITARCGPPRPLATIVSAPSPPPSPSPPFAPFLRPLARNPAGCHARLAVPLLRAARAASYKQRTEVLGRTHSDVRGPPGARAASKRVLHRRIRRVRGRNQWIRGGRKSNPQSVPGPAPAAMPPAASPARGRIAPACRGAALASACNVSRRPRAERGASRVGGGPTAAGPRPVRSGPVAGGHGDAV